MNKKIIKHFDKLNFTVIAIPKEYRVDYMIYEIIGESIEGERIYELIDSNSSADNTEDIDLAQIYCHGHVKWDGCSNWHFDIQDDIMIHACTKTELMNIGIILSECWEWTRELCDEWLE